MSNPTALHKPYDVVPVSTTYQLTVTTDNAVPTAADGSVYNVLFAPLSGVRANVNRFGPKKVRIKGYFTGTDKVNADCQVALWEFDEDSGQWYATNAVTIAGTAVVTGSLTKGSQGNVDTDPRTRRAYLEVSGLSGGAAAQTIVLMVTKVE